MARILVREASIRDQVPSTACKLCDPAFLQQTSLPVEAALLNGEAACSASDGPTSLVVTLTVPQHPMVFISAFKSGTQSGVSRAAPHSPEGPMQRFWTRSGAFITGLHCSPLQAFRASGTSEEFCIPSGVRVIQ